MSEINDLCKKDQEPKIEASNQAISDFDDMLLRIDLDLLLQLEKMVIKEQQTKDVDICGITAEKLNEILETSSVATTVLQQSDEAQKELYSSLLAMRQEGWLDSKLKQLRARILNYPKRKD